MLYLILVIPTLLSTLNFLIIIPLLLRKSKTISGGATALEKSPWNAWKVGEGSLFCLALLRRCSNDSKGIAQFCLRIPQDFYPNHKIGRSIIPWLDSSSVTPSERWKPISPICSRTSRWKMRPRLCASRLEVSCLNGLAF